MMVCGQPVAAFIGYLERRQQEGVRSAQHAETQQEQQPEVSLQLAYPTVQVHGADLGLIRNLPGPGCYRLRHARAAAEPAPQPATRIVNALGSNVRDGT